MSKDYTALPYEGYALNGIRAYEPTVAG